MRGIPDGKWWEVPLVLIVGFILILGLYYLLYDATKYSLIYNKAGKNETTMILYQNQKKHSFEYKNEVSSKKLECENGMAIGPTEEFNNLLSRIKPQVEEILIEVKRWESVVFSNNIVFDGTPIKRTFVEIYTKAINQDDAIEMLDGKDGCLKFTTKFWKETLSKGYHVVSEEFIKKIQDPLLNLLLIFRTHSDVYRTFNSLGSTDEKINLTIVDLEKSLLFIEDKIKQFSEINNCYFEKNDLLNLVNKIRHAKNLQELCFWTDLIENISSRFFVCDKYYNVTIWRDINEEIKKMRDNFPLR